MTHVANGLFDTRHVITLERILSSAFFVNMQYFFHTIQNKINTIKFFLILFVHNSAPFYKSVRYICSKKS